MFRLAELFTLNIGIVASMLIVVSRACAPKGFFLARMCGEIVPSTTQMWRNLKYVFFAADV